MVLSRLEHFLHATLTSPPEMALAIILGVLLQEDVAIVATGLLAAEHFIPIPLAIGSIAAGAMISDFGLYGIGRIAITHPRLRNWVEHERLLPVRGWLASRLSATVATVQCLPGTRLPTFLACGFFSLSFRRYALTVLCTVIVWAPLMFACSYYFGVLTLKWLGALRWLVAIGALPFIGYAARSYWKHVLNAQSAK